MTEPQAIAIEPGELENWGGFTAAAAWMQAVLGERYFSRQRAYSLYQWRTSNGFPERQTVRLPDGREKDWFRKSEIEQWAVRWSGIRGGSRAAM
jgi:hypothetical protein